MQSEGWRLSMSVVIAIGVGSRMICVVVSLRIDVWILFVPCCAFAVRG